MPDPDTPEQSPDLDLDDALYELRQKMADASIVCSIIDDLRRSADRLKPMLRVELLKLRNLLDEILPLLPP
jgi:hypothetical protein